MVTRAHDWSVAYLATTTERLRTCNAATSFACFAFSSASSASRRELRSLNTCIRARALLDLGSTGCSPNLSSTRFALSNASSNAAFSSTTSSSAPGMIGALAVVGPAVAGPDDETASDRGAWLGRADGEDGQGSGVEAASCRGRRRAHRCCWHRCRCRPHRLPALERYLRPSFHRSLNRRRRRQTAGSSYCQSAHGRRDETDRVIWQEASSWYLTSSSQYPTSPIAAKTAGDSERQHCCRQRRRRRFPSTMEDERSPLDPVAGRTRSPADVRIAAGRWRHDAHHVCGCW